MTPRSGQALTISRDPPRPAHVPGDAAQAARLGPAAVAVHDDPDVEGPDIPLHASSCSPARCGSNMHNTRRGQQRSVRARRRKSARGLSRRPAPASRRRPPPGRAAGRAARARRASGSGSSCARSAVELLELVDDRREAHQVLDAAGEGRLAARGARPDRRVRARAAKAASRRRRHRAGLHVPEAVAERPAKQRAPAPPPSAASSPPRRPTTATAWIVRSAAQEAKSRTAAARIEAAKAGSSK